MRHQFIAAVTSLFLIVLPGCASLQDQTPLAEEPQETSRMQVHYLEIVTSDLDETCAMLAEQHGVSFSAPEASFGNARIADLEGGGRIGVRAPMGDEGAPVVRPYLLVEDIEAASKAAEDAGAEFAMRATEMPGQGKFAIYFLGGIQHGLWEK